MLSIFKMLCFSLALQINCYDNLNIFISQTKK